MNRKREDAERKRARAIALLRSTGMTDAEIDLALGKQADTDTPAKVEPVVNEHDSAFAVDSDGIIDAEIVELSTGEPMDSGFEPVAHLPARISEPTTNENADQQTRFIQWTEEWWQHAKPHVRQRRCVRIKRDGTQCLKAAILGGTVCTHHGGAAKHIKMSARARIENAQDRLAKELLDMAVDPDMTPQVKLTAIRDALDRGGLKAPTEVVLSQGTTFDEVFDGIYSGARVESGRIEPQADSSDYPPAAAMPADDPEPTWRDSDYTNPHAPQTDERRERRQAQRPGRQNGAAPITGYEAMHAANELRALPRGSE